MLHTKTFWKVLLIGLLLLPTLGPVREVSAGVNVWTSNGPEGGDIRTLAVDPQTPTTLYAGTYGGGAAGSYGGGVFKSVDGGATWSAVNTGLTDFDILSLAIDPQTPTTLYVGTYNDGVFKSTDGGATWNPVNTGLTTTKVYALAVDPQTPATLYAGTEYGGGVFKSTDGGGTWSAANTGLMNTWVRSLVVDPQTPTTLYAGTDGGVFKSTDGAVTWNAIDVGLTHSTVPALVVDPQTPATLYAGTQGGGVFKSTDGGATWSAVNTGLTATNVQALVLDSQTPGTIYAGILGGGVFKSTDGGATWSAVNTGLTVTSVKTLVFDPQMPSTLYAGTSHGGVFKSMDGAVTWSAVNSGLNATDVRALAVDPQMPTTLYAAAWHRGVFKSADGGMTWILGNFGLTNTAIWSLAVDPQTPGTLYAGTGGGGLFRSADGGETWISTNTGLTEAYVFSLAIDPQMPSTLYVGTGGGVFKSTDGSGSWNAVNTGLTNIYVFSLAVDPQTPATLYAGTMGGVFKSTDGGGNWNAVNTGLTNTYVFSLAVDPQTPTTLYAGTGGGVFKSTDGGATWSAFNTGLPNTNVRALVVDPQTPTTLYAGTSGGGVFKSINGGVAWNAVNTGLMNTYVRALAVDPQTPATLYAGTRSNGVFSIQQTAALPAPTLSSIYNAGGNYTVSWSSISGAISYTLQEAISSEFTDATTIYFGNNTSTSISDKAPGTYYYRVRASNAGGDSAWSNIQSVIVTESTEGDSYEPDDTCAQARTISIDGTVQERTFHQHADEDWVVFTATAGVTYRIEGYVPVGSPADVNVEVYDQCVGDPLDEQHNTFSPGVRLEFTAPADGPLYLRWFNHDPAVYGADVAYHVSVQALSAEATPGAVIIVAGRYRYHDPLQNNIHYAAGQVYQMFQNNGYPADRIYYLSTELTQPGANALATVSNLEEAITTWALGRVDEERPLTLYLVDHGIPNRLYLDKPAGEWVTPAQLDTWLAQVEAARSGLHVNVFVEACYAGSFIGLPQSLSRAGRVVVASTGATNLAYASDRGAIFSDHFSAALNQGASVYGAFESARGATRAAYPYQTPWLDANGNGIPNEPADAQIAALRGFAYAGTLSSDQWPPYIAQVAPVSVSAGAGDLRVEVRDDSEVRYVWAVIYPPSYTPPTTQEELVQETLPPVELLSQGNDWYGAKYTGFNEIGEYRVVFYAEDDLGLAAQPVAITVRTGWAVYLPIVARQ